MQILVVTAPRQCVGVTLSVCYLRYDSLSGLVVLEEQVVGLYEKLARVFLNLGHPPLPQQHGAQRAGLHLHSVDLLRWPAKEMSVGSRHFK